MKHAELARLAADLALQASTILSRARGDEARVVARLPHDLKLSVDTECEEAILAGIRQRYPGHSTLSEEAGTVIGAQDYTWIVDPLDGTVNYLHGLPFYCTSIGCVDGSPDQLACDAASCAVVAGAVYAGGLDQMYVAARGSGATLNGRPLHLDGSRPIGDSMVSVSLTMQEGSLPLTTRLVDSLAPRVRKVRSLGSTALELAMVASGTLGAFLQRGTNLWDFGAARLLVEEAGGKVDLEELRPGRWQIIAADPGLYPEIRRMASEAWTPHGS